eukprot:9076121-Alexandrium_andersonii.AAC.1
MPGGVLPAAVIHIAALDELAGILIEEAPLPVNQHHPLCGRGSRGGRRRGAARGEFSSESPLDGGGSSSALQAATSCSPGGPGAMRWRGHR